MPIQERPQKAHGLPALQKRLTRPLHQAERSQVSEPLRGRPGQEPGHLSEPRGHHENQESGLCLQSQV